MYEGWIKLHRRFLDWEWFQIPEMVKLFIFLLLSANIEDKKWNGITVRRGQLVTGRRKLSEMTGISDQSIRTGLARLKETGEINQQSTNKYSIITICKYEDYQINESNKYNESTNNQPATNQQLTTTKEYKNIRIYNTSDKSEVPDSSESADVDYKKIVELYHNTCTSFSRLIKLSEARKQKIRIRFVDEMKQDWNLLESIFMKMEKSKFLRGDNRNGWKASFDWVFENGKNWVKVAEGNYDDKPSAGKKQNQVNDIWEE